MQLKHWWQMSGVHAVLPDPKYPISNIMYSSLYRALVEVECFALVRYVGREDGSVHIGGLVPNPNLDARQYFLYCQFPFAEDYRPFEFPSLSFLADDVPRDAKHHKLDTRVQKADTVQESFKSFIHSMDLMHVTP